MLATWVPAVGLQVEADDLDRPDALDALGQQVDLGPDQVGDREGLGTRQDIDPDVAIRGKLRVHGGLDRVDQVARHRFELEVHPAGAGFHVAAGDLGAVIAPHHAAQRVERGVRAHQRQPAGPVEVDPDGVADGRWFAADRLELVGDLGTGLAGTADGPRAAVVPAQQESAIRGLAAATRVEHRPVEDDEGRVTSLDMPDPRLDRSGVGVRVADLLAGLGHPAVSVPVMSGWTLQTNEYAPAASAGTS